MPTIAWMYFSFKCYPETSSTVHCVKWIRFPLLSRNCAELNEFKSSYLPKTLLPQVSNMFLWNYALFRDKHHQIRQVYRCVTAVATGWIECIKDETQCLFPAWLDRAGYQRHWWVVAWWSRSAMPVMGCCERPVSISETKTILYTWCWEDLTFLEAQQIQMFDMAKHITL